MSCPRQEPSITNQPLLIMLQPLLMANLHPLMALLHLLMALLHLHLLMALLHLHLLMALLHLLMAILHLHLLMAILHLLPPVMVTPPVTRFMAQVLSSPIRVTQASVIWTMLRRLRRFVCPASRLTVTRRVWRGAK